MTFNSIQFFVLLAIVLALYWRLRLRGQNRLLLVASYVFYGWWDARFLFLLAFTTVVDFYAGQRIQDARTDPGRRAWMIGQVSFNLAILAIFKYFDFFIDSGGDFLESIGLSMTEPALELILPVGLSFYVFHEISYAVDVYRRRVEAERNVLTYALFIAYFPLLVAGPIERAWHLLPQLRRERTRPDAAKAQSAIALIVLGLFKKVVLADGVAPVVNEMFASPSGRGTAPLVVGAVGFAIQIYGDFSGYSDIARGVSRLFGIEVFRNFEEPYLSTNITQFWRTWHISLSSWLHDYLYVPLGGNRHGRWSTYRNLILTMLLGGLWHGAAWTFVVWGGLHGVALAVHRALGASEPRRAPPPPAARDIPRILGTFALVCALWVIFRADSLSAAFDYFTGMVSEGWVGPRADAWVPDLVLVSVLGAALLTIDLVDRARRTLRPLERLAPEVQGALVGLAIAGVLVWSGAPGQQFIYFQF